MSKIIIGNWKMNPGSLKDARVIFNETIKAVKGMKGVEVVICPPFPFLSIANDLKIKNISLGAQNVFEETEGAYTGEVSLKMLLSLGVKYVILGHSESRLLGETNKTINKKILAVLKAKITPILCAHAERKVLREDRLIKTAIAAMKQSLKATLPKINKLTQFEKVVKTNFEGRKFIAHCDDNNKISLLNTYQKGENTLILIGPEGDFSKDEINIAINHNFEPITFGASRLRTETAGVVACHTINLLNE